MSYKEFDGYYLTFNYIESLLKIVRADRIHFDRLSKLKNHVFDEFSSCSDDFALEEPMNEYLFYASSWDDYYRRLSK